MTRKHKNEALNPEVDPVMAANPQASGEELPGAAAEAGPAAGGDIESLAAALDQKTKEAAEANEKYLRTYADFENYRKRMQRDQADFKKYANEQMALELLAVLDHLGLALKHACDAPGKSEGLQQGVEMVFKQFRDVLEKFGIKPFKTQGEPFDPSLHEALMQVETGEVPENTVVQVFQDGYRYHEKVLRHAKVGVSKRPSGAAAGPAAAANTGADEHSED
ncbi:MAG: nucleotide exchange factor GrpE [Nitrospirota bacterium]